MSGGTHIGRVGALAVALGVGVGLGSAVLIPSATAYADAGSESTSGPNSSHGVTPNARPSAHTSTKAGRKPGTATATGGTPGAEAPAAASVGAISDRPAIIGKPNSSPFGADSPTTPTDSPIELALAAASRRELDIAPIASQRAAVTTNADILQSLWPNPITVSQTDPALVDGILTGNIVGTDSKGYALTYTVLDEPNQGGKVSMNTTTGKYAYLPDASVVNQGSFENFSVLVTETTPFDAFVENLIPQMNIRQAVQTVLIALHRVPILNVLLAPLIGSSAIEQVTVDVGDLVPQGTPVAYTAKVISFDGTLISTNFFPAPGLAAGETAPTILTTSGLGFPGNIDPYSVWDSSIALVPVVPGIAPFRTEGYNVITWDPRGEGNSTGTLQLDAPEFEGRDVQELIDYAVKQGWTTAVDGDPLIGMAGGSYGGGIQLVAAAMDSRIDAIVPAIAWNTLNSSLYPDDAYNTLWGIVLPTLLIAEGAHINPEIYLASITGVLFGFLTPTAQALLARTGPGLDVTNIHAPTLLVQGTPDTIFPLDEAMTNAQLLGEAATPVKMLWYCGGHGVCLDPRGEFQNDLLMTDTLAWLDRYLKDETSDPELPTFQWVDQNGEFFKADLMPFDAGFKGGSIDASAPGGLLPIASILGGGGPSVAGLPVSLLATSTAMNAVTVTAPSPSLTDTVQVVGPPELTFSYQGIGTAGHIFAQIIDDKTGMVLGNAVTPISVELDGQKRTITVPLHSIAYTMTPGTSVTLQLTNAAIPFDNITSLGLVDLSDIHLSLPTVQDGVATRVTSIPGS
jgi:ABC-2 type transport system ATP-binding protein